MIKERFTVPSFAFKASVFAIASPDMSAGRQDLMFRVKHKIEIQKPHFLK
jgi:hypothetical protein